jgi:antitoxin component YwqK of YwqJK toxin-antitoxin module
MNFLAQADDAPNFMSVHDQESFLLEPSGDSFNETDENGFKQGFWDFEYKESPEDDDDVLIREVCYYVDGKRQGRCEFWRCDMMEIIYFENGVPHGSYFDYDDEGHLRAIGIYENGFKSGDWRYFDCDGNLTPEGEVNYNPADMISTEFPCSPE